MENNYEIASVLFNMTLDLDYINEIDESRENIQTIEQELNEIEKKYPALFYTLNSIAFTNRDCLDWHKTTDAYKDMIEWEAEKLKEKYISDNM